MVDSEMTHPWFSGWWTLWLMVATPWALFSQDPLIWILWAFSFIIPEALAVAWDTSMGDTLSEAVIWAHRRLAKPPFRVDRGWTAVVSILITMIVATTISPFFWFTPPFIPIGLFVGYLEWRWLFTHWIRTALHG